MDEVVDAVFAIECRSLPVDHAWALSAAIQAALPWFADEPQAGLHTVHGAASGAGWMRPDRLWTAKASWVSMLVVCCATRPVCRLTCVWPPCLITWTRTRSWRVTRQSGRA